MGVSDKNGDDRATKDKRGGFSRRRFLATSATVGTAGLVSACLPSRQAAVVEQPLAPPTPTIMALETIGAGPVKIALLASKSALGQAGLVGTSMINAAKLAIAEFPDAQVTISVYDTTGTGSGAETAAQQAITDGAQLILGPFFADEVRGAGPVARTHNIPMLAFSSDPSVAQPGVYIMGFLVSDEVRQLMAYAQSQGKHSLAAMMMTSAYGTLAEGALRQYATQSGIRIVQIVPFSSDTTSITTAGLSIAAVKDQIDCLFLPDGAGVASTAATVISGKGVSFSAVQLIGSGQWNVPSVYQSTALAGGWFPAPDIAAYNAWAARYRAMFAQDPLQKSTLVYDGVFLAAALVRSNPATPFAAATLTSPQGALSAVNGLFRLNPDGTNNRGLAIYQITGGGMPNVVSPAPRSFGGV